MLEHLVDSRAQAEDVAQEVFLRVYRSRKQYVAGAKFATWLFTIANNAASNAVRDRSRRHEVNLRGANSGRVDPPDGQIGPGGQRPDARPTIDKAEMRQVVQAAMESLSERQRLAVLVEQIRGDELRRHRRDDGIVARSGEVAVVAGEREFARGPGAVFPGRAANAIARGLRLEA